MAETKKKKKKKDEVPEMVEVIKAPEAKAPTGPKVAAGKSITSKRGILGPGEPVKPEDFSGGQKTIDQNIKNGYVVV